MTELRLHRSVYRGEAIDEVVKLFAPYASFVLREEPDHWIVEIHGGERERRIAGEVANYALGVTVKMGGAAC